jgi:hypothetical protein
MILNINNNRFIVPIQRKNSLSFKSSGNKTAICQTPDSFTKGPLKIKAHVPAVQTVVNKSQYSYDIFKGKMDSIFYDCTRTSTRNPNNALGTLQFNDERFMDGQERIKGLKIKTGLEARNFTNNEELISARIILDNGTQAEGNRVLSRLIKAADQRSLIVREIRTYGEKPQSLYATSDKINGLLLKMNDLSYACAKVSQRKDTGYHAIHVKCQLENGFMGTLEIMGKEMSKLKDIESVLYRLSVGKPVDEKFKDIEKAYGQLTQEEKQRLTTYTKASYIQAREDEISNQPRQGFLPIANYELPDIFDFNNLAQIA